MKDDRLLVSLEPDYAEALGRLTFCFAILEWEVVWCSERIKPGVINQIVDKEETAGQIAKRFQNLVRNMPASKSKQKNTLSKLADDFMRLVQTRNDIIHAKPCTAPGPEEAQRLSGEKIYEIPDLENAADLFAECGGRLNDFRYEFLE